MTNAEALIQAVHELDKEDLEIVVIACLLTCGSKPANQRTVDELMADPDRAERIIQGLTNRAMEIIAS